MNRLVWVILVFFFCVNVSYAQEGNFGKKNTKKTTTSSLLDDVDLDEDPTMLIFSGDTMSATSTKLPMKFTKKELSNITDPRVRDMYWYALNDTTDKKRYLRAHYAFNNMSDNWSFEGRVGVQTVFVTGFDTKFALGPQLEIGFKKDIHPYWSGRVDLGFGKFKHEVFTNQSTTMLSDKAWANKPADWAQEWWQEVEYSSLSGRVTVMVNLLNMFAGRELIYSPVNLYVYGGAGGTFSAAKLGQRDGSCLVPQWCLGAEVGYNLTQRHMITFDAVGSWQGDDLEGYNTSNSTWKVSAMIGLSYRFSRMIHFQRLGYDETFNRQQVLDAVSEGDIMQTVIESQRNEREVHLPADMIEAAFFQINRIELQHTYVLNLGFYAELIKQHPTQKFLVKGFADIEVGSIKRNLWLCEQRAKVVADVLTKKYGVDPDQLIVGGGDLDLDIPFLRDQGHHKFNRCTIICPINQDYQIIKVTEFDDQNELNSRQAPKKNY